MFTKTAHSPEILWERHKNRQPASEQDARPGKPGLIKPGTVRQSLDGLAEIHKQYGIVKVRPENLREGGSQLGDQEAGSQSKATSANIKERGRGLHRRGRGVAKLFRHEASDGWGLGASEERSCFK